MNPSTNLPDNLVSKFSRIYITKNQFTADDGKIVEYERFCLDYHVKDQKMTIEVPIKKDSPVTPKDILLLQIADNLQASQL